MASFRLAHSRTLSGVRLSPSIRTLRPWTPRKRSPKTGWSRMPSTGTSSFSSAISEPHSCRPVMKARVPSTGSSTQRQAVGALLLAQLLTQDAVIRPLPFDDGANSFLTALVRFGDRIENALAGLVRDRDALAEIGPDHRARGIGQAMSERHKLFVRGSWGLLPEGDDQAAGHDRAATEQNNRRGRQAYGRKQR